MEAVCQCGAVNFKLPADKPIMILHCHCSLCRAQSSSAFGTSACFWDFHLPVETQPIRVWSRATFDPNIIKDCYFCSECGVRIMHRSRGADEPREERNPAGNKAKYQVKEGREVSVKGGCIRDLDWRKGQHIYCGDAVTNLEFPETLDKYVEDIDSERWNQVRVETK